MIETQLAMQISSILIFFLSISTNTIEANLSQDSEIIEIRFGTSFGKCSGYCIQEISFKDGIAEKTLTPHRDKSLKPTKCSLEYTNFNVLAARINVGVFNELEEVIGCPDCDDGGAEWVQIFTSDGIRKKVTYSYDNEPVALKLYIDELREYFEQVGECK